MSTAMKTATEPETMTLAEVLQEMDFAFVAAGDHSLTVEEAVKFITTRTLSFWTCGRRRSRIL